MATARVTWTDRPRTGRAVMQSRLPSDPPDHPFGKWSLVLELGTGDHAEVRFLVDAAPHHELKPGARIELLEGPRVVGLVEVLS